MVLIAPSCVPESTDPPPSPALQVAPEQDSGIKAAIPLQVQNEYE
jgi:hypothetical protein